MPSTSTGSDSDQPVRQSRSRRRRIPGSSHASNQTAEPPRRGPGGSRMAVSLQWLTTGFQGAWAFLAGLSRAQGRTLGALLASIWIAALCGWWFIRRGYSTGDPQVNLPIWSLHPEDLDVLEAPFPIRDLVTLADMYSEASSALFPHYHTNTSTTLALDAPGLVRVDPAPWLALPRQRYKTYKREPMWTNPLSPTWKPIWEWTDALPIHANDVGIVVDRANTTLTLDLLEKLWPLLIHAANDLLVSGLGRHDPSYQGLSDSLARPSEPALFSLVGARVRWVRLHWLALKWPVEAWFFLDKYRKSVRDIEANSSSGAPRLGSLPPPTALQLLRHARRQHQLPGPTLPEFLATLPLTEDAAEQVAGMRMVLTQVSRTSLFGRRQTNGLGVEDDEFETLGICSHAGQQKLKSVVEKKCPDDDDHDKFWEPRTRYATPGVGDFCNAEDCMVAIRNALCDAERFLSSLAAAAEEVETRVLAERGRMSSWRERLAGYCRRDGVVRRARTLRRALDAFHALYPALDLQRRILVGAAARMLRACQLQDALRARVLASHGQNSAWWDLRWNADRETVEVTFVTVPEWRDTNALLKAAQKQLGKRYRMEAPGLERRLESGALRLQAEVSEGWVERLGLAGLPLETPDPDTPPSSGQGADTTPEFK